MVAGDEALMGADTPPDRDHKPKGFSVSLGLEVQEEAERIFAKVNV